MSSIGAIPDGRATTSLPGLSRVASGKRRAVLFFANRYHSAWDSVTSTQTSPAAGDVDRGATRGGAIAAAATACVADSADAMRPKPPNTPPEGFGAGRFSIGGMTRPLTICLRTTGSSPTFPVSMPSRSADFAVRITRLAVLPGMLSSVTGGFLPTDPGPFGSAARAAGPGKSIATAADAINTPWNALTIRSAFLVITDLTFIEASPSAYAL